MKKHPAATTEQSGSSRFASYALYHHRTEGWVTLSDRKSMAIYRGEATLPDLAIGTTVFVFATVRHDPDGHATLVRLEHQELQFDADGRVDQGLLFDQIKKHVNGGKRAADDPLAPAQLFEIKDALRAAYGPKPGSLAKIEPKRAASSTAESTHAKRSLTVAEYLAAKLDLSEKTQTEVSELCGFARPNMISMLKYGKALLPLDKVRPLAKALGIDPVFLFLKVMKQDHPVVAEFIDEIVAREIAARRLP